MLPAEAINEFKELYRKQFGVELTNEEAAFRANNLVNLYKFVYGESPVNKIIKDQNYESKYEKNYNT